MAHYTESEFQEEQQLLAQQQYEQDMAYAEWEHEQYRREAEDYSQSLKQSMEMEQAIRNDLEELKQIKDWLKTMVTIEAEGVSTLTVLKLLFYSIKGTGE